MAYLFYRLETATMGVLPVNAMDPDCKCEIWEPTLFSIRPRLVNSPAYFVWWLFHRFHIFRNRNYAVCAIYKNSMLVHRSLLTPGYFRFPFMLKDDLQIGDTWTPESYRGKGLAKFAIRSLVEHFRDRAHAFWYVVDEENHPSIAVIEKMGFELYGTGEQKAFSGIGLLKTYTVCQLNTSSIDIEQS
jgi:RimJ/RimL family protein N-acetyltransferase